MYTAAKSEPASSSASTVTVGLSWALTGERSQLPGERRRRDPPHVAGCVGADADRRETADEAEEMPRKRQLGDDGVC